MRVSTDYFKNVMPSRIRMAKEPSLQMFPVDLFVKGACYVVRRLHKYIGLRMNNRLLYLSRKTLILQNCLKCLLVVTYLSHLPTFSVKTLILLVLFGYKLLKLIFKANFYMDNIWMLL